MTCDILIRSYYRDFRWLAYSLRSIRKYCHGFSKVIVVVPEASREKLDWMRLGGDVTITCADYRDDYLGQQVSKLTADQFSDADFICHIDSDCVFRRPTCPGDLFEQGRPRVLMAPYDRLDPHVPWKGIVERLLRLPVDHEFMRMPPYTFPRWIYPEFRAYLQWLHGMTLEEYVLSQPPRGFSEFNALTAFARLRHAGEFSWRDVETWPDAEHHCRVYWSWGGIDEAIRGELEQLLA